MNISGPEMNNFFNLRSIGTILVLVSLALPLSKCQSKAVAVDPDRRLEKPISSSTDVHYTYPHHWFSLTEWKGVPVAATFAWPGIMVLVRYRSREIRRPRALAALEAVLCIGGGYLIWGISAWGERLVGAYLSLTGMGLYLVAAMGDIFRGKVRTESARDGENHRGAEQGDTFD